MHAFQECLATELLAAQAHVLGSKVLALLAYTKVPTAFEIPQTTCLAPMSHSRNIIPSQASV